MLRHIFNTVWRDLQRSIGKRCEAQREISKLVEATFQQQYHSRLVIVKRSILSSEAAEVQQLEITKKIVEFIKTPSAYDIG